MDWILWQTLNSRYWSREGLQPCVEYWDWKQSHSLTEHTVLYFLLIVCDVWFLVIFRLFIFKWILKSCSSDVLRVFTDRFFVFRNRKAYALLVESNTAVHSTLFQYMLSRYTHYLMCFSHAMWRYLEMFEHRPSKYVYLNLKSTMKSETSSLERVMLGFSIGGLGWRFKKGLSRLGEALSEAWRMQAHTAENRNEMLVCDGTNFQFKWRTAQRWFWVSPSFWKSP